MRVEAFAERVLKRPLWTHQVEAANSDRFVTTIAAARRTGKTVLAETLAMHTAFANRGCRVLVLSATQDAARRVTENIGARLTRSNLTRGAVVDDYATRIRLTNGSEIVSLPASQRQVRGYGEGVLLVILDEAGFMASELWTAAHYTALDERANGSRILLVGTPWGPAEHFFRRAFDSGQTGDADHASFQWTHTANPQLDHAYLERQRDRVSPSEYAAEVLGEWSDAAGSLFSRELLERQTADIELPKFGQLVGPARPAVGLDWGVSFDRSAAAVLYRLPLAHLNPDLEPRPRFVVVPHVWPQKEPLGKVVGDVATSNYLPRFIATETSGVGAMPSQELVTQVKATWPTEPPVPTCTWFLVATTNARKTAGYGCLLGLLESGQLILPRHPDLLRQLAGLRFEQGERAFTRIEAESAAVHDDVADALMLATMPHTPHGSSRVRCHLAHLAHREQAVADARLARSEEPVVETQGGLRLPRRPALQSLDSTEATLPPGAERSAHTVGPENLWHRIRTQLERRGHGKAPH